MKHLCLLLVFCSTSLIAQKQNLERSTVVIPPKQVVQIDYPFYKGFVVKLWNKAKFDVGVSAREHDTDSLRKGFGLSKGANATLNVPAEMYLQLENRFWLRLKWSMSCTKENQGKEKQVQ